MTPVEFSVDLPPQLEHIASCMNAPKITSQADFAITILALRELYQNENPRYFDAIQSLEAKNPSWITIEFLKSTPPSHIRPDKLQKLFDLTSKVYLATNKVIGTQYAIPEDKSNELACWLYEITRQLEVYEANQTALASVAKGVIGASGITTLVSIISPWLAPIGLCAGYFIKRLSSSEPTLQDRRRLKPIEYIDLNNSVRYVFEPESSGLYGRHVQQIQSYTLGELEIDLNGEAFSCLFNLNNTHKINPSDVSRLHFAMLRRLNQTAITPERCMSIIEALEKKELSRGNSYTPVAAFLDPQLSICLDALKQRCQMLIKARKEVPNEALKGVIFDVSGYKNGCGLYALAASAIIAHKRAKAPHNALIPEFLLECKEEWLGPLQLTYNRIDQLHTILRETLANALEEDTAFKADNEENFISACLNVLSGQRHPAEMRALFESNELFMANLSEIVSNTAYQLTAEERAQNEKRLQSKGTLITPSNISAMQRTIKEYFSRTPKPWETEISTFDAIFDTCFETTQNPIDRIIQQRKLYLVTCMSCPTLEQRQWWRGQAERWLQAKLAACLQKATKEDKIPLTKLFGFLSSTNFEGEAKSYTLPLFDDIIDTETLRLLVASHVSAMWPQLFANYVKFIKCENCMLTADELLVLAKKWHLNLSILEWGPNHEALPQSPGQLGVYLTNPSKIHWKAFVVE